MYLTPQVQAPELPYIGNEEIYLSNQLQEKTERVLNSVFYPQVFAETITRDEAIYLEFLRRIQELQDEKWAGQCMEFIRRVLKIDPIGNAWDITPNRRIPAVGTIILTTEGARYHGALIIKIEGDELILAESNFDNKETIEVGRRIKKDYNKIRGYYEIKSDK